MSFWGKVGGAVVGFMFGGPAGAVIGAGAGHDLIDQPQEIKEQAGAMLQTQEQIAAAEREMAARIAGERFAYEKQLTEKQMRMEMGRHQIELLANLFLDQDRTEAGPGPRVLTLPSTAPTGIIDQINLAINRMLRA